MCSLYSVICRQYSLCLVKLVKMIICTWNALTAMWLQSPELTGKVVDDSAYEMYSATRTVRYLICDSAFLLHPSIESVARSWL